MEIYNEVPYFDEKISQPKPFIQEYLQSGKNNSCVIVCPGGGYEMLAAHEQYKELFYNMGLSVFVLTYRLNPYHYPCQLLDMQRAIKFVKYNAEKFGINPDQILVAGSSAGGHLALSTCTFVDEGNNEGDEVDKLSSSVAGGILCYPVVSLTEFSHEGTSNNFSGGNDEIREKFSIQKTAHKDMPPLFVWHTITDNAVDVCNVLRLCEKYHQLNLPMELHIFDHGYHGMGVAGDDENIHQWTSLCQNWLIKNKFIQGK